MGNKRNKHHEISHKKIYDRYTEERFKNYAVSFKDFKKKLSSLINRLTENGLQKSEAAKFLYEEITLNPFFEYPSEEILIQDVLNAICRKYIATIKNTKIEQQYREHKISEVSRESLISRLKFILQLVVDTFSEIKPDYKTQYAGFLQIFLERVTFPTDIVYQNKEGKNRVS